jgi:hypothetical protein
VAQTLLSVPASLQIPVEHRQERLHPSRRKPLLLGTPVPVPPKSIPVQTEQGLPGKQIGVGSPPDPGIGSTDRAATPNAVPSATTRIPSMIFTFMCLSSAAVAAWHGF